VKAIGVLRKADAKSQTSLYTSKRISILGRLRGSRYDFPSSDLTRLTNWGVAPRGGAFTRGTESNKQGGTK